MKLSAGDHLSQRLNSMEDAQPHSMALHVGSLQQLVGALRRMEASSLAVSLHQVMGTPPNLFILDHNKLFKSRTSCEYWGGCDATQISSVRSF